MTQREFEVLLREAFLRDATEACAALPLEEELHVAFPATSALDAKTVPQLLNRPPTARPKTRPWYRQLGRMVAMLLLSFGLLLCLVMTNAEARDFVKRILFEVFSDHNEYSFPVQDSSPLQDNWEIGYVPEGFALCFEERLDGRLFLQFAREDGALLSIFISTDSGNIYKDNEHYSIERQIIRGEPADVYHALDSTSPNMILLYSEKQSVVLDVSGNIPTEELVSILEHITPRPQ